MEGPGEVVLRLLFSDAIGMSAAAVRGARVAEGVSSRGAAVRHHGGVGAAGWDVQATPPENKPVDPR